MFEQNAQRTLKFESEVDPNFPREITAMPGGENLFSCIQCGRCSGACPLSIYMDYTPRRIIAMTRAGFKKEVLSSFTIWLCTSCYICTTECSKQLKITDIMYALKQKAIKEKVYPKRFTIPTLAREFFKSVMKSGRNTEGQLILKMFMKTNPLHLFKMRNVGKRLFFTGRMGLIQESIKHKKELQTIMKTVEGLDRNDTEKNAAEAGVI